MNPVATARPRMIDPPLTPESADDARRVYEASLTRAMGFAERYVPRDQALEIAHDVASEMLRIPRDRVTGTLIYIAVTNRLRQHSRAAQRRAKVEGAYHQQWSNATPAWAEPGAELEIGELQRRVASVIGTMPPGMREVFVLIRGEELSYKDAAERLGISVGTVHTQLSRASALLRECVAQYQSGLPQDNKSMKGRRP